MDDFYYEDIPSCVAPTNLTASNITGGSADFSWTPGGNETLWNIQWGNAGFTLGTGTIDYKFYKLLFNWIKSFKCIFILCSSNMYWQRF